MIHELILAAGEINSTTVINTPIFGPIKAIFRVIAIMVVLGGTWKAIRLMIKNEGNGAVARVALFTLGAAFLLWDIGVPLAIVDSFGPLVTKVSDSIKQVLTAIGN